MPLSALRILIVDRNLLIAKQVDIIVSIAGYHVVGIATQGETACALILSSRPDVVILDAHLDGGAGAFKVAAALAETGARAPILTIAQRKRVPVVELPYSGIVEKPFTRATLLSAVRAAAGSPAPAWESEVRSSVRRAIAPSPSDYYQPAA